MMHPAMRSTLVAVAMITASVGTSPLAAQGAARATKVDPCSLLSVADVKRITGKTNYDPADRGDPGDGIGELEDEGGGHRSRELGAGS